MELTIDCVSKWKHVETGKTCRVLSSKDVSAQATDFFIQGYNPLPCFSFKGTYRILEEWLKANGWVRDYNQFSSRPDTIVFRHKL